MRACLSSKAAWHAAFTWNWPVRATIPAPVQWHKDWCCSSPLVSRYILYSMTYWARSTGRLRRWQTYQERIG